MLPDQPLLETKIRTTPDEFARLVRGHGDVYWWERGGFYVVTRYRLAETVLRSPDYSADRSSFFISRMPNLDLRLIGDFFGVISKMMVMSDGAEHTARRKVAGMGLTDALLEHYRPRIDRTVERVLARSDGEPTLEFATLVAQALPSLVLADLFEIPEENREDFYAWSNNMTQFFGGASRYRNEDGVEVNRSAVSLRDYFRELIGRRRKEPGEDFLSILLRYQETLGLTDGEVVSQAVMMLVAGQVTTTDQMNNNLYGLMTRPGCLEAVRRDPALLPTALEEFNRLDPAVTFLFRVAKRPVRLGEVEIPEKGVIFVSTHAVNRDPEVFERPDECVLDRRYNPHFAFGHGPHFCLGAKLARIQMGSLFGQLLRRYPELALEPERPALRKHHSLAFSGFESIPLRIGSCAVDSH